MKVKDVFQHFLDHERDLKVLYVASGGTPQSINCAPKLVAALRKPLNIYLLDLHDDV